MFPSPDSSPKRRQSEGAWLRNPRNSTGALELPAVKGKLSSDVLLATAKNQVQLCHRQLQQDLDFLHEQLHAEVHSAVTVELQGVAQSIAKLRRETVDELQRVLSGVISKTVDPLKEKIRGVVEDDVGSLRAWVDELSGQVAMTPDVIQQHVSKAFADDVAPLSEEVARLREDFRVVQEQSPAAVQETAQVLQAMSSNAQKVAVEAAEAEASRVRADLQRELSSLREELASQSASASTAIDALQMEAAASDGRIGVEIEAMRVRLGALGTEQTRIDDTLDGVRSVVEGVQAESLQQAEKAQAQEQQLATRLDAVEAGFGSVRAESLRLAEQLGAVQTEVTGVRVEESHLAQQLESMAHLGEARFQEAQTAVVDLEARVDQRYGATLQEAVASAAEHAHGFEGVQAQLQSIGRQCHDTLAIAKASWARVVEWSAEVDLDELQQDGRVSLVSPSFMAACFSGLRLRLRIFRGSRGWNYGAFLCAPEGQISFRLHVAGRCQTFEGVTFGNEGAQDAIHEWGSPKIAVLSNADGPKVLVKFEILDVLAPIAASPSAVASDPADNNDAEAATPGPQGLSVIARLADEAHLASREAAAIRASLVRRVEWRVTQVSKRLDAARRAYAGTSPMDDEALEPLISPPFSAAGLEGLQLHLYPIGRRPKGDELCSFYLLCPKGVSVRCKAFVGDAFCTFEHSYDSREPYGRGSLCRIGDKAGGDDSVVCGVEFAEVRQESMAKVKGGPYGNFVDQLKVVMSPSGGGLHSVRELAEAAPLEHRASEARAAKGGAAGGRPAAGRMHAPGHAGGGPGLARGTPSKSLPSLTNPRAPLAAATKDAVGGAPPEAAAPPGLELGRGRRQLDGLVA
mmetsp:Transcript_11067/g.29279  ORF Transcript_11067/g.29279 Transcript_11067/m.29279 type:complete len:858 (-) Transcript_11067:8-2581(-)